MYFSSINCPGCLLRTGSCLRPWFVSRAPSLRTLQHRLPVPALPPLRSGAAARCLLLTGGMRSTATGWPGVGRERAAHCPAVTACELAHSHHYPRKKHIFTLCDSRREPAVAQAAAKWLFPKKKVLKRRLSRPQGAQEGTVRVSRPVLHQARRAVLCLQILLPTFPAEWC